MDVGGLVKSAIQKQAEQQKVIDAKVMLVPPVSSGDQKVSVSIDVLKSAFLGEGLSPKQLSERYFIPLPLVKSLIKKHKLVKLRNDHINAGLLQIQNKQIAQAHDILSLEAKFKQIKLEQLKVQYENYMVYYSKHGDFYKRAAKSGKIMCDSNGIPKMVSMPNAVKELRDIRDSLVMGKGIQHILNQLNALLNQEDVSGEDFEIEDLFG